MTREYIDELNRLMAQLNTSASHRERVFLEARLQEVQQKLESSEKQFSQFASANAALDVPEQGKAILDASSQLEGQLIAAQTELQGLREIYTDNNIRVREEQARIDELERQIGKLRGDSPQSDDTASNPSDSLAYPSIRKLPQLGVGHVCEDCLTKGAFQSIRHSCYRKSLLATAASGGMVWFHRMRRTWNDRVDRFIALTHFSREKFAENGIAAHKIVVKPNSLARDPGYKTAPGDYALFVGRLSSEKGLATLLAAWARLPSQLPLRIVGSGPQRGEIESLIAKKALSTVRLEGHLSRETTFAIMKQARFLIFPSEWYECFPTTLLESFACGLPVIAARIGAMTEIIEDGRTGVHFKAGNPDDLVEKIQCAWTHPGEMDAMARAARSEYLLKYTPERNYAMLMDIYRSVVGSRSTFRQGRRPLDAAIGAAVEVSANE